MKNFCFNAFTGLDISTDGYIKPCCKFLTKEIPKFNIRDGITSYKESDFLKKLQEQFINDERPTGCSKCWVEEDAGIKSKRQLDYIRHKKHFDLLDKKNDSFTNISIAFGNICNFACRICGPDSSSRWVAEILKNNKELKPIHQWYKDSNIMNDIFEHTKDAVHFDIPGGEPLLLEIKEHFELLKKFDQERAKKISLHYTTNGSVFPDQKFLDVWKSFEEIDIQMSIDDIGKRFEYNRWPGKWNEVYDNIKKFQTLEKESDNIKLSISFTVSAFTIYYANEFYKWCMDEDLPSPWMGRLNRPVYYRAGVFGKKINDKIRKKLSRSKFFEVRKLSSFVKDDDYQYNKEFLQLINKFDFERNQKFQETFPELI